MAPGERDGAAEDAVGSDRADHRPFAPEPIGEDADGWVETAIAQVREQDWSVVVIHDIEAGCLSQLPELLQRLTDLGVMFEQAFPRSVVLTEAGRTVSMSPDFIAD